MTRIPAAKQRGRQAGLAAVEFAIIGGVCLLVLLGTIEMGRLFFALNTVSEATRRAARIAAVCPINDATVARMALFDRGGSLASSRFLDGLEVANISVQYFDEAGAVTALYPSVAYVRVSITGYQHEMMIPFIDATVTVPAFSTTLPVGSLGYVPDLDERVCLGA